MMQGMLSLPLFASDSDQAVLAQNGEAAGNDGSINAVWVERPGSFLHPTPLGETGEVLSLNLARGCMHRCAFCSVRAAPNYPEQHSLQIYSDTPARLDRELG